MYKDINEEIKDLNSKESVLPFNSGIYCYLKTKSQALVPLPYTK